MAKSIIITGAGRGIGAATAHTFLDAGYRVGLIGRNEDTLAATAIGHENALVLTCDVGEPDQEVESQEGHSTNDDDDEACSHVYDKDDEPLSI